MNDLVEQTLKNADFFAKFPPEILQRLEQKGNVRSYKKNSHIINQGDDSNAAYLLLTGAAYAYTDNADGNEFVVNSIFPGDCFGELGLLDNKPRTAHVKTVGPSTCLVISKAEFQGCIKSDIHAANATIEVLVDRIRHMTEDISCLALMDVYGRISRVLNNSVRDVDSESSVTAKMTHQDIANRVGASREMVSKILKDLTAGGYITTEKKQITILKTLPLRW